MENHFSLENPMNSMKRKNDRIIKEELPKSVQYNSVAQSCPTVCDPMNRSTPGLPVHHQLPEFTQTRVHKVSDTIQPSHPLAGYCFCFGSIPSLFLELFLH